ncbi:MAG: glycosyltransferase [Bacteroidales bacterium]|jgi:glycosyltransferase involved in cell wall biosynthesis
MPGKVHKPKVIFSVTNCICHDQRVQKIAEEIKSIGAEVTIVGRRRGVCCRSGSVQFRTRRFRMIFRKGFLFYMFFNIRLFFYLLFHRSDLLVSNDLDTLLPGFLISKIKRVKLVYDSHEYFTGVPELQNRPFVKGVWSTIERSVFPRLKHVMTVSDSIADQYMMEYGIRPLTVRNCSPGSGSLAGYSRKELGIDPGKLLLVLQGGGINIDRGGEELIRAMSKVGNAFLFIIGSGDVLPLLKNMVNSEGLAEKMKFFPKMPWQEMMRYTKSADAGFSLDKNTNINYRFSLPNKLFDYISAGIPVVAGDLPEVTRIITDHSCGIVIPEISPDEIIQAIRLLDENRDLLKILKQNSRDAAEVLNWEKESVKVREFYSKLLNNTK